MRQLDFYKSFFAEYTTSFDTGIPEIHRGIMLKKQHSLEVFEFAEKISHSLELSDDDFLAAMAAALFHDIGRFEQFKRYRTYIDRESVNHAAMGVKVLRQTNILKDFPLETKRNILCAVACHNLPHLPAKLSKQAAMYCNIVRDADKLDIFRIVTESYETGVHDPVIMLSLQESDVITPDIAADVIAGKTVAYHRMNTAADFKMVQLGWFNDFNFPSSYRIATEFEFAARIIKHLPDTPSVRSMEQKINALCGVVT